MFFLFNYIIDVFKSKKLKHFLLQIEFKEKEQSIYEDYDL